MKNLLRYFLPRTVLCARCGSRVIMLGPLPFTHVGEKRCPAKKKKKQFFWVFSLLFIGDCFHIAGSFATGVLSNARV